MRLVYWLRRIPAETRIVVLVVFLALFQSLLLSVFGLVAIGHERQEVENRVHDEADRFLRTDLVPRCQYDLRDLADVAFAVAFDPEAGPLDRTTTLFREAYRVTSDGSILAPFGEPLLLARGDATAASEADDLRRRYRGREVGEEEKPRLDLAYARRHPFARDEFGESLALPFAATPLLADGPAPGTDTLLAMRWIGVLNRVAGEVAQDEVARFLALVDAKGSGDPGYATGVRDQGDREARLRALSREISRLPRDGKPRLVRGAGGPAAEAVSPAFFYVRPGGADADLQVLAVDPGGFRAYLDNVVKEARGRAREGIEPAIVLAGETTPSRTTVPMEALPGYVAEARISADVVRAEAADRERFYRYIIGFSVAGILAGGFLTVRAVTREVKLAKLKSGFVSNVTHELKTPLTSIRMFVEMLRGGEITDDAERDECLEVIGQESDRLGRLIQQVLDFGRLDAHRRRFHWTTASIVPVLLSEADRFRRATGLAEGAFRVEIAPGLPPVVHDAEAMAEVVSNLLSNAWKYSPAEGKRIVLRLTRAASGRVALSVDDNGPGIPPAERDRIFEQFYRVDDRVTRDAEGTGLGLAIVRGIVRAHGGRVRAEEAPGGGSRFVAFFPAASVPPGDDGATS